WHHQGQGHGPAAESHAARSKNLPLHSAYHDRSRGRNVEDRERRSRAAYRADVRRGNEQYSLPLSASVHPGYAAAEWCGGAEMQCRTCVDERERAGGETSLLRG